MDKIQGAVPVDTKCVYVIKRKADGSVGKFKARKVGRGYTQQLGIDYNETRAQTMRTQTMKGPMVIALAKGRKIRQRGYGAYLRADLQHMICVTDIDTDIDEKGETRR